MPGDLFGGSTISLRQVSEESAGSPELPATSARRSGRRGVGTSGWPARNNQDPWITKKKCGIKDCPEFTETSQLLLTTKPLTLFSSYE